VTVRRVSVLARRGCPLRRLACWVRAFDRRVGYRGSVLLFFTLWAGGNAVRLAWPSQEALASPTLVYLGSIAPLWLLALPWAVASLASLVCAFRVEDRLAFGVMAGVMAFWAVTYLAGAVVGVIPQGVWACIVQVVVAGLVLRISGWSEPHRDT